MTDHVRSGYRCIVFHLHIINLPARALIYQVGIERLTSVVVGFQVVRFYL